MATCPVRFEFYCDDDEDDSKELKFTHDLPRSLVDNAHSMGRDAGYNAQFAAAVMPIVKQHEDACKAASPNECEICEKPATSVLQTPMSWLHNKDSPFVGVQVNAFCGGTLCEAAVRQGISDSMAEMAGASVSAGGMRVDACNVCGQTQDIKKCGRCGAVSYCGRDHQKDDWKSHKAHCKKA